MSKTIDEEVLKNLISFQQAELNGVVTYQKLAELTDDPRLKEVFEGLAADEGRHAAILKSYTGAVLIPDATAAGQMAAMIKNVDIPMLLEGMAKGEYTGYDMYETYVEEFPLLYDVMRDEHRHGDILSAEAERLKTQAGK